MMKKLTTLLAFLLCACLMLPCAMAQEAYIPGAACEVLVADVLGSGRLIRGDAKLRLDVNGALLGLDEEEAQILDVICALLDSVTLGVGAGKTGDGLRIELSAALANAQGGDPVTVDAAANLTPAGVSLESGLIQGQRVTAKWETLLAMAGMNDSDIVMLMSLRDTDWETLLPQMMEAAQQYLQIATQALAPYGETIAAWAAGLQTDLAQDVQAVDGYPAAATEITVTVTEKDVGALIALLANQLKADATMCSLLDLLLQEAYTGEDAAPTTAQLCDEMIAAAAEMTGEDAPLLLVLGMDADGVPLYGQMIATSNGSVLGIIDVMAAPSGEGIYDYSLSLIALDGEGAIQDGAVFAGAAGESVFTVYGEAYSAGEQVMGIDYALSAAAQDELPSLTIEQSMNMAVDDGDQAMQIIMSGNAQCTLTEDGGEVIDEITNMDIYTEGETVTVTSLETLSLFPTEDGLAGTYGVTQSIPAAGIDSVGFDVMLSTGHYDPAATAALRETALETASAADIDELLAALTSAAQTKAIEALQALPTEALSQLIFTE